MTPWLASARNGACGLLGGIAWLLLLSAYQTLPTNLAWLYAVAVTGLFALLHILRRWPTGSWCLRLRLFDRRQLPFAIAVTMLLTALQVALFVAFGTRPTAPVALTEIAGSTDTHSITFIAIAIFAAPLIEEFGFRAWLQTALEQTLTPLVAITLSAIAFTVVHGSESWYSHALSGLLYGFALWISGSIWLPVLLHGLSNAIIAGLDQSQTLANVLNHWMLNVGTGHYIVCALLALVVVAVSYLWYRTWGYRTWGYRTLGYQHFGAPNDRR